MTKYMEVPRDFGEGGTNIVIYHTEVPNHVGEYAMELARHFATVAAVGDGEDSAGRAKLRLQTPGEIVKRSCDIAETMWNELQSRKLTLALPDPKPPLTEEERDARYTQREDSRRALREARQANKLQEKTE